MAPIIVETTPGHGLIAWCDECDNYLDLSRKVKLVKQVIDGWATQSPDRKGEFAKLLAAAIGNVVKQRL